MVAQIEWLDLAWMVIPLLVLGYFMSSWGIGVKSLIIATVRMVIQLVVIGYLLIYIFNTNSQSLVVFILSFMIVVAGWIAIRQTKEKKLKSFLSIIISIGVASTFILILILQVIHLEVWYESRYTVPLAGMIVATSMNALSLFIERLESELTHTNSFKQARNLAFSASMIPQINALLAVGLVSLPGMMTGQILSGVSPLVAVRYQIVVMVMGICVSGLASIIYSTITTNQHTKTKNH